jgi:hypothetical protein
MVAVSITATRRLVSVEPPKMRSLAPTGVAEWQRPHQLRLGRRQQDCQRSPE